MTPTIGINGFGRIGRTVVRAIHDRRAAGEDVPVVAAVNDIVDPAQLAHLLEYDSVAGRFDAVVAVTGDGFDVGGTPLRLLSCSDPAEIPWRAAGVHIVIESSRLFTAAVDARRHLDAGAAAVIVSAPSEGADATFVVGVNDHEFDPAQHRVVSNASCTTNCLAPMLAVLDSAFGVEEGLMTTVHAYTSDQPLVDMPRADARHARAAAINVVPTSTGAARAIGSVLPAAVGRLDGSALRVPVPDGSLTDLTVRLRMPAGAADVNDAFRQAAAEGPLAPVLDYSERPLVSSDIVGSAASCTFDAPLTLAVGSMVKVFGWYDNEWGYANRLVDLAMRMADRWQPKQDEASP